MTPSQYKTLKNKAQSYYKTLNLDDIKLEFSTSGLLNQNKKLSKGSLVNLGLELTPSKFVSKLSLCGGKEGNCVFTCIAFTGVDNIFKSKTFDLSNTLKKRIRRTFLFLNDRSFFDNLLRLEISKFSLLYGFNLAIRLNVVSDIDWSYLIKEFENVKFYDYSKHHERPQLKNYVITYSSSERVKDDDLKALLGKGFNVAIVFDSKKLPQSFLGFEVINGDETDNRYDDKKGVIVGLSQKTSIGGKTKTNFIRKA